MACQLRFPIKPLKTSNNCETFDINDQLPSILFEDDCTPIKL